MYDESAIEAYRTSLGLPRYRLPAVYPQLNKHRFVSSDTAVFAVHKATIQEAFWHKQLEQQAALKHKKLGWEMNAKRDDLTAKQKHQIAQGRTQLAVQELHYAYRVLARALEHEEHFSWDCLKVCCPFPIPKPGAPEMPTTPLIPPRPREPLVTDMAFLPHLEPLDRVMRARREAKEQAARDRFEKTHKQWEVVCRRMLRLYQEQAATYKQRAEAVQKEYKEALQQWESARERYNRERQQSLELVAQKAAAYLNHESHAVLDYCDMVLTHSDYPPYFPQSFDLDYDEENRFLMVDYLLPPLRVLPRLAKVIYNEEADTFHDILLSEEEQAALYARVLEEVPLRTIHELFSLDTGGALMVVQFRGYLFLDENKDMGKPPSRVVTIQADRADFSSVDLHRGEPAAIFEELGGVIHPL